MIAAFKPAPIIGTRRGTPFVFCQRCRIYRGERAPLARAIIGSKPKTDLDVNPGLAKSAEPENLALLRPGEWQAGIGEQLSGGEVLRMAAFEDRPGDIGREIAQPSESGNSALSALVMRADGRLVVPEDCVRRLGRASMIAAGNS